MVNHCQAVDRAVQDIRRPQWHSVFSPRPVTLGLGSPRLFYNSRCAAVGLQHGAEIERLDASKIRARFPFLTVEGDADGLVETGTAGHISPRRFVQAQTVLAKQAGAEIIRQAARAIRPTSMGVEIELADGSSVKAEKGPDRNRCIHRGLRVEPAGTWPDRVWPNHRVRPHRGRTR